MKNYPRYTNLQVLIHWLTAVLVLVVILLALCRDLFSDLGLVFMLHKSMGLLILILTIFRFVVIKKQGVPEVLDDSHKIQRALSKSVQGLIYILLIIMPLSGYLMSNRGINFFGLFSIPGISLPIDMHSDIRMLHIFASFILIALILLHVLAALYHHFWVKDNVLKSMWFAGR